jgi:regulator of protease activity HflC (stomatin/prohibitin superfamily)
MFDRLIDLLLSSLQAFQFLTVIDAYQKGVVLRLGKYHRTLEPGLHAIWPFYVERVLTDDVVPTTKGFDAQSLVTKDGVSVVVCAVVTFKTRDVKRLLLEVENAAAAMRDATYGVVGERVCDTEYADLNTSQFRDSVTKAVRRRAFDYGIEVTSVQFADLSRARSVRLWGMHQ